MQDASKLITESIDANAKVIFGTVYDDRLKKNELKITVIASGFSDVSNKKSLFANTLPPKEEEKKSKLFSTFTNNPDKETESDNKNNQVIVEEKRNTKNDLDDDSDWGAVPAFLRRQKK